MTLDHSGGFCPDSVIQVLLGGAMKTMLMHDIIDVCILIFI